MAVQKPQQTSPASVLFPVLGDPPATVPRQGAQTGSRASRRVAALLILIAGAALPAWIAGVAAHPSQTREIHIEAYRYGFSPCRIHANRGDRLRLTFSTRDTGQSFFIQDFDLHVSITPGNKLVSVVLLSHPDDPRRSWRQWRSWRDPWLAGMAGVEIAISQPYRRRQLLQLLGKARLPEHRLARERRQNELDPT